MSRSNNRVLPGFYSSLSFTLLYLTVMVAIPLVVCIAKASTLTGEQFVNVAFTPRAMAAYGVTFKCSLAAAFIDTLLGLLIAWVLVRYEFPFKSVFDSLIDLPFALPTAVAGLVYSTLYVETGWLGHWLVPMGFHGANSQTAIVLVLTFVGLPFVVRSVEPVLASFDADVEEAAACLGATRWQTFCRVLLPQLWPSLMTGFTLSLARGIGEYGSVIFVSGNIALNNFGRQNTEIAPFLIVSVLENPNNKQAEASAAAIACVLLVASFALLIVINILERRSQAK
jgi:sulfate transport system permease protein